MHNDEGYPGDDVIYDENDGAKSLHGYNNMSSGCGEKIQLENPDKREPLVCYFGFIGGIDFYGGGLDVD